MNKYGDEYQTNLKLYSLKHFWSIPFSYKVLGDTTPLDQKHKPYNNSIPMRCTKAFSKEIDAILVDLLFFVHLIGLDVTLESDGWGQ